MARSRLVAVLRGAKGPASERCSKSLSQRPLPLYSVALDLAILWNAKAGCTFASKWLWYQEGLLSEALAYSPWPHEYRQQVYCRRPGYPEELGRIPSMGPRALKFVRDPYDRAVSGYLSFANQAFRLGDQSVPSAADEAWAQVNRFARHPRARSAAGLASDARQVYVRYRRRRAPVLRAIGKHLGRAVGPGLPFTFREYVDFLGALDLDDADPHVRRQVSTCERLGQLPDLTIVRIEESAKVLPRLEDELGLRRSDQARLRTSRHHTRRAETPGFVGDSPFEQTWDIAVPASRSFYDEALLAAVTRLYADDIDTYGYGRRDSAP